MSGIRSGFGLLLRIPTVLRTLAHLRPTQARAQLRHALVGLPAARPAFGSSPSLVVKQSSTFFLKPPAHVKLLGHGRIEMLATAFDLGDPIDWDWEGGGPLFAYHLHQHEALRLADFRKPARAAFLRDWIEHHRAGVGWDPHPISLRLFCWGKLLTTPGLLEDDADLRDGMLRSMSSQAETLSKGLEIRLQANHLLSNLMAVVFAGLLLDGEGTEAWRDQSALLLSELDRQVRPDGGHEERSPMYHSLLLENVLDLLNLCRSEASPAPAGLEEGLAETATRMLVALEVMTHPDGEIALFADSAFGIAASPEALLEYAARLSISPPPPPTSLRSRHLPQTGYLRLRSENFDLLASVGGPSPAHQPGHAHCDALSFELSAGGHRLVTDTGLFEYRPGARRDFARTTSSHSTLQFDGEEQAEVWAAHRVGGRPVVEWTGWDATGSAEITCRGWSSHSPLHRRFFSVEDGSASILDHVEGSFRDVRFCLPIDPAWKIELVASDAYARATLAGEDSTGSVVEIDLAERFAWTLERSFYYPTFGCEVERFVLVGVASDAGVRWGEAMTRFRWSV